MCELAEYVRASQLIEAMQSFGVAIPTSMFWVRFKVRFWVRFWLRQQRTRQVSVTA